MDKSECSPIPDIISFALFFWQGSSEWTSVESLILRHECTLSQSLSRGKVLYIGISKKSMTTTVAVDHHASRR